MADIAQWNESWHVDKKIPLALIIAILVQTGTAFWWASSVSEKVENLELWQKESKNVSTDIAVIKSQISDLRDILRRIESRVAQERNSPDL